ncbi:MAG: hypothetical protein EOP87_10100 [Verrucomicrobiaceae bacterium]|nr:MAG: hypothetical protein EOP87_10100 [Verrucomicrobiaceae bacterium]
MTPRPIHKWKTFWLGILIIAFLGWAWLRSCHSADFLEWYFPAIGNGFVSNGGGSINLGLNRPDVGGDPFTYYANDLSPVRSRYPLFPIAFEYERRVMFEHEVTGPTTAASIAHWFLILLFLIPWLFLLLWRSQRMKRQATGS